MCAAAADAACGREAVRLRCDLQRERERERGCSIAAVTGWGWDPARRIAQPSGPGMEA